MAKLKKKQKEERILILTAILFLILSSLAVFWSSVIKNGNSGNNPSFLQSEIIGKASLTVDFGNGQNRVFEGNIVENETFMDVLNQAARAGSFSYELNKSSNLASIGELVSDGKKSWRWYLNGKKINESFSKIIVKSDDIILIKYE